MAKATSVQVQEILSSMEKVKAKLYHMTCFVDKYPLTDDEANALTDALDAVYAEADKADDALFNSADSDE